jgi:hypothetical protein
MAGAIAVPSMANALTISNKYRIFGFLPLDATIGERLIAAKELNVNKCKKELASATSFRSTASRVTVQTI